MAGDGFDEVMARPSVRSIPLAHLSIELGHLYFEDFAEGPDRLRRHFERVKPWVTAVKDIHERAIGGRTPRVSTCFLLDDYFGPSSSPEQTLPPLIEAANEVGLTIDYLARESGCAEADGVALAELVRGRIVAEPSPGADGSRPPVDQCGWLSNGQRSPGAEPAEAMASATTSAWHPPSENAVNRHSVFVDVQLWDTPDGRRRWSCAYLASVWQLLRLGLLRSNGEPVASPSPPPETFPREWAGLPAIMKLNPSAAPFSAYRAASILHGRFFPTEHAVRTILSQVSVEPSVAAEVAARAASEGLTPPLAPVDRLWYVVAE